MATVGAGLVVGTLGSTRFTPEARAYLHQFWEYAAFAANSLIFLLVGMSVHLAVLARHLVPIGLTIAAVLVARAVTVYGLAPAITRLPGAEPIDGPTRFVLFWGGLRGAVALALVLSLPTSFPSADLLVVLAVGVVLFTLLSGGLTMRPLMHALGLDRPGLVERAAAAQASLAAKRSALERIRGLGDATHVSRRLLTDLETEYGGAVRDAEIQLDELRRSCSPDEMRQVLWAEALAVERQAYREGFEHGAISEPVLRELELSTDLRRDRLRRREIPSTVEWATPVEIRLTDFLLRLWGGVAPRSALVRRHRLRTLVAQYERDTAVLEATERVTGAIAHMAELTGVEPGIAEECRASYQRFASDAMGRIDAIGEHFPEYAQAVHERAARRIALDGELDALEHLVAEGGIPENVVREAQRQATQAQRRLQRTAVSGLEPNPEEILARVPFFAGLDSAAVASVVNALVPRTYTAGAVIIRQGDRGTSLFLISRGVVAVVLRRDDGREARVASLQPGDFFGEMALLSAEPRSATVRAVTACHLYELAKRDVDAICESVPAVRLALIRASEERTRRLIEEKQRRASGASPRAGDSGSTTPGGR
jgi:CPA1 family monovalent cation:H+ antiporter